jgi:hypothetical protein
MGIKYATREDVKLALDIKETARADADVDSALDSSTDAVHALTLRRFYPWTGTRSFDWPVRGYGSAWRLWLDSNELASITTLVAGGTTLTADQYFLRRSDDRDEVPYDQVQISLSGSGSFSSGPSWQKAIVITGVYIGCPLDEDPAGALAEALDATETAVNVSNGAAVGVGSILRVDSERMLVTGRQMLTTAQTLQTPLTASLGDETVAVTTGSAFNVGEVVLLDAERMYIVDIAGNNLIVKRKWDGSTLAAHTGSTIFASRTLTVERGALGTTAAIHSDAASLAAHRIPGLVREYAVAYALDKLLQRRSGYSRTVGSGESEREMYGRGLREVKRDLEEAYGRRARVSAV